MRRLSITSRMVCVVQDDMRESLLADIIFSDLFLGCPMACEPAEHVTRILASVHNGDANATEGLLTLMYDELRRLAEQKMAREPAGHTL